MRKSPTTESEEVQHKIKQKTTEDTSDDHILSLSCLNKTNVLMNEKEYRGQESKLFLI